MQNTSGANRDIKTKFYFLLLFFRVVLLVVLMLVKHFFCWSRIIAIDEFGFSAGIKEISFFWSRDCDESCFEVNETINLLSLFKFFL